MKIISRILLTFILLLTLITGSLVFHYQKALAQVPGFLTPPCGQAKDPNFNSLRPFQAAPCADSPKMYYCTNMVIFYEGFHGTSQNPGLQPFNIPVTNPERLNYKVKISGTTLPIYGNTEQVKNAKNSTDSIDDATKLNEYVSWYLSGVNGRAEYGEVTDDQAVNFAGPLKKLLPTILQDAQRIDTIDSASKNINYTAENPDKQDGTGGSNVSEPSNHDQVVVCQSNGKAVPCPGGYEMTLKSWDGSLSFLRSLSNLILGWIAKIPGIGEAISNVATQAWDDRKPPVPWGNGPDGKPFASELAYQKAYNEWKGQSCIIVPAFNFLLCVDNPLVTNVYADLYSYVPLTNNSDKSALMPIMGIQVTGKGGAEIDISDPKYAIVKQPVNWFAHKIEDYTNVDLLTKTYKPEVCKDGKCTVMQGVPDPKTVESGYGGPYGCKVVDTRTNAGDQLFTEKYDMEFNVAPYTVTQLMCDVPILSCNNKKDKGCTPVITGWKCSGSVEVRVRSMIKDPYAQQIFDESTGDSASVFRKIYPKVGLNAPVSCIANIPGTTNAVYERDDEAAKDDLVVRDPATGRIVPNTEAKIYFPLIGSVYDYFLKGIQTALRPKGYADPSPKSGQFCDNISCGELPKDLPKASGSCSLGGISPSVGDIPQSLKDIISAAAQTYKVPPNLLLGIMYGEGLFNPGRFNWTDTNVKNWATCQKIPSCNETGDDNFMGFNGNVFENIVPHIKGDIQKMDPTRKTFSQCNLLDTIYAEAYNLHASAAGGGGLPATCYNIPLHSTIPNSCSWNDSQYESAIKVSESGYTNACLTLPGSCATGGGLAAACPGGDTCEHLGDSGNTSHNACVWNVGHGN